MKVLPHFQFTDNEKQLLNDYYLPLHHLCKNVELMEKAERLVRGDLATYTKEQTFIITQSVGDLYMQIKEQANEEFWNSTGVPHGHDLARMRMNELAKVVELLESLLGAKVPS